MENSTKSITLPNIEKAKKDLAEYEHRYYVSAANLKTISNEVENLKVEKQALIANIDQQKRVLQYYTNLHIELASKIQKTLINHNKAKLVESSNMEKIKHSEAKAVEDKIDLNQYGEVKFLKKELVKPKPNEKPRGITQERKDSVLNNLSLIMPQNRLEFWKSLSVNNDSCSLINNYDDN